VTPFQTALAFALDIETSKYTNDPDDAGGPTKWGITSKTWEEAIERGLVIRDKPLTAASRSHAETIFRALYWDPIRADDLWPPLALLVFDCAIHSGISQAALLLQRVLRVEEDAVVGPDTLAAARLRPRETAILFVSERLKFYQKLILQRPSQVKYANGWRTRAVASIWAAADLALKVAA